jgi:hypothetical protein
VGFSKRGFANYFPEMLGRFAITPWALAEGHCSSTAALELGIGCLYDLCRAEGLFTDLREGEWSRSAEAVGPLAKRFLTFARKERRLIQVSQQLAAAPDNDEEWLWEAQALHGTFPCRAIITHKDHAAEHADDPIVTSIERLNLSDWWAQRSPAKNIARTTTAYLGALDLVLRHANSLMFIDPHIDPVAENYREFPQLLLAAGAAGRRPLIEIHRASWRLVQGRKDGVSSAQWMADFEPWSERLVRAGLSATVFLWETMHDRYLITDLVGINVPNGFDIATDPAQTSTWTNPGPAERDRLQKEFDCACGVHRLVNRLEIGAHP